MIRVMLIVFVMVFTTEAFRIVPNWYHRPPMSKLTTTTTIINIRSVSSIQSQRCHSNRRHRRPLQLSLTDVVSFIPMLRARIGHRKTPTTTTTMEKDATTVLSFTQVISDVDDTLKSSGGIHLGNIALGGIDTQYKRNTIYPGVADFMLQLSLDGGGGGIFTTTPVSSSSWPIRMIPKVAILTARAYELKVFLELKDSNPLAILFRETARQYQHDDKSSRSSMTKDWGFAPILYGSIMEWIVQDRKGLRKFHNFEHLVRMQQQQQAAPPQYSNTTFQPPKISMNYIYVGDTGEYDEEAGMAMLQYYPQYVQAVFLHVVSMDEIAIRTSTVHVPPTKYIHGRPMIYFRTYVGAAVSAWEHGLIRPMGLQHVVNQVEASLSSSSKNDAFTKDQRYDLEYDLHRAKQVLKTIF